jgi:hypothetical protein
MTIKIIYLPTAQEIPIEPAMGSDVVKFIKNPYTRFYYSATYDSVSWTTCAPHLGKLGGEIPKHLIQVIDVQDS